MAEELGEVAENGLETSNKFEDASTLNDKISEANEKLTKIKEDPEIKKIKEDLYRQQSKITSKLNEEAKKYQNSEDKFHNTLSNTIETQTGTKILENDMGNAVKNYKPGERTGEPKQDVVNETLTMQHKI